MWLRLLCVCAVYKLFSQIVLTTMDIWFLICRITIKYQTNMAIKSTCFHPNLVWFGVYKHLTYPLKDCVLTAKMKSGKTVLELFMS